MSSQLPSNQKCGCGHSAVDHVDNDGACVNVDCPCALYHPAEHSPSKERVNQILGHLDQCADSEFRYFEISPETSRELREYIRSLQSTTQPPSESQSFEEWQRKHGPSSAAYDIEMQRAGWDGAQAEITRLRNSLKQVGDDYPGSSCQKWCYEQAGLPLTKSAVDFSLPECGCVGRCLMTPPAGTRCRAQGQIDTISTIPDETNDRLEYRRSLGLPNDGSSESEEATR